MKILFTGASSPTGMHMIKELVAAGHEVTGTIRKSADEYEGLKKERLDQIKNICTLTVTPAFGDDSFIELLKNEKWDLLCHHAADASDPRSTTFDWKGALKSNTNNLEEVVDVMVARGCTKLLVTGSFYEANEGVGSEPREAFSPYGLSKTLTWESFRYFGRSKGVDVGKFTIPIAFGITEDPKLTTYLVKTWFKKETPEVRTPAYLRDYIPFDLMAKSYAKFIKDFENGTADRMNPGFYQMTNGEFARLFATKLETRIGVPCKLTLASQTEFPESKERVNNVKLEPAEIGWDEDSFWDSLAKFYLDHYNHK